MALWALINSATDYNVFTMFIAVEHSSFYEVNVN